MTSAGMCVARELRAACSVYDGKGVCVRCWRASGLLQSCWSATGFRIARNFDTEWLSRDGNHRPCTGFAGTRNNPRAKDQQTSPPPPPPFPASPRPPPCRQLRLGGGPLVCCEIISVKSQLRQPHRHLQLHTSFIQKITLAMPTPQVTSLSTLPRTERT